MCETIAWGWAETLAGIVPKTKISTTKVVDGLKASFIKPPDKTALRPTCVLVMLAQSPRCSHPDMQYLFANPEGLRQRNSFEVLSPVPGNRPNASGMELKNAAH
jgi:hypothetical protein